ncbi:MAG: calcium-binding protein [Geitlerinemataceae cyanobacterium]
MPQPNNGGSSSVSGSVSSFVNDTGAGGSASVTATSPDGQTSTSSDEVFTPGATSTSASVQGSASSNAPPQTSVTVKAPADDYINGNQESDWIEGNEGNDTLCGGQGNDIVLGGDGNDRLFGDLGDDYLNGNQGEDVLEGKNGNDTLQGGQGNDVLLGGEGNDVLIGDLDRDVLTGGSGADTFILRTDTAVNDPLLADTITDFQAGEGDKIGLTGEISAVNLVFEVFDSNADGIADATRLRLDIGSGSTLLGIVLNSVDVMGATVLTSADFITM